ncbi:hypothetical protein ACQP1K_24660 [Sphaerimonospora sp. CA-214678]|uniref:hypothetical protein n=1 Tax=Sphaerimonospora sp. CA-214678 TaxID=3240029 RepID=UPI003D89CABC
MTMRRGIRLTFVGGVLGALILPSGPAQAMTKSEAAARVSYKDYTRGPLNCHNTLRKQPAAWWIKFRRYSNGQTRVLWVKVNGHDEGTGTKESIYMAWRGDNGKTTYFFRSVNYHYAYWNLADYIGKKYVHKRHKPYVKIGFKWNRRLQQDLNCVGYVNVY